MLNIISTNLSDYQGILLETFKRFLIDGKASEKTRVNYMADVRYFLAWLTLSIQPLIKPIASHTELLKIISKDILDNFKRTMILDHAPIATINRRLSSLRMFFRCAVNQNWLTDNPMEYVTNLPKTNTENTSELNALMHRYIAENLQNDPDNQENYRNYLQEFFRWMQSQSTLQ